MRGFKIASWLVSAAGAAGVLLVPGVAFAQDDQPHWLVQHSLAGGLALLLLVAGIATAVALHRAGRRRDLLVQSFDTSNQARQLVGPGGKVIFANAAYRGTFERFQTPLPEMLTELVEPSSTSAELLRQLPKTI